MKIALSILTILLFTTLTSAQEAAPTIEQLKRSTSDLQKSPDDAALREKVIKLALTVSPKPSTPPEADELFGRAKYLINNATSDADFAAAAKAFADASNLAPWESDYYFNQGLMFEKAKQYEKAIAAFKWYLMAAPDSPDAKAAREKIGGLKVATEKASEAEQVRIRAEQARAQAEEATRNLLRPIEELKGMVLNRTYYSSFCTVGYRDLGGGSKMPNGCNWAETQGVNWYSYSKGEANYRWDFSMQGEPRLVNISDRGDVSGIKFRGRSTGGTTGEMTWECPILNWNGSSFNLTGWKPAFVTHSADFRSMTLTCDTGSPQLSPSARFQYLSFKMN